MAEIVVGVDESECAGRALRWAVLESEVRRWPVTAVIAWGFLDQHRMIVGERFDPSYGEADALAALDAAVVAAVGAETAPTVGRRAVCDLAARALLDTAATADLLVVGRRGIGGFRGLLLGSVSEECVQRAPCPVAVIGPEGGEGPRGLQRIVVGIDGSETARRALRWALEEGRVRQAAVEVVHVWHAPYVEGYGYPMAGLDPTQYEQVGRELLKSVVEGEDTSGLPVPVKEILTDDGAARSVLEAAKGADLVVVGSRGMGGLKRWLLGSVSHQVIHHASCPVLVVPAAD